MICYIAMATICDLKSLRCQSLLLYIALVLIALTTPVAGDETVTDFVPGTAGDRVAIVPIIFVPSDYASTGSEAPSEIDSEASLLLEFIRAAQSAYKDLLKTDTFQIAPTPSIVYRSDYPAAHYSQHPDMDSAHLIVKELLEWSGETRFNSSSVFVVVFARSDKYSQGFYGGGRTFNGPPNTGGGYVELDYSALLRDEPYPFLSTLIHELGHAFGLAHVDCHGRDMETDGSIMSYNQRHWSDRLNLGSGPGSLNPEEYFLLAQNLRVFPSFRFDEATHNPDGEIIDAERVAACYLGPMASSIGDFVHLTGVGYELYFDGIRVNGPQSAFWSYFQARANVEWNVARQSGIEISARYNGRLFYSSDRGFIESE